MGSLDTGQRIYGKRRTMPVAKYQRMIVAGRATIYRIRRVKLQRRNMLPMKPHASEAPFSPRHHFGSAKPIEASSTPGFAGSKSFLQDVTSAVGHQWPGTHCLAKSFCCAYLQWTGHWQGALLSQQVKVWPSSRTTSLGARHRHPGVCSTSISPCLTLPDLPLRPMGVPKAQYWGLRVTHRRSRMKASQWDLFYSCRYRCKKQRFMIVTACGERFQNS